MKSLTIEELKALPVGEWVWIERLSEERETFIQIPDNQFYYRVAAVGDDYKEKFFEVVGGELRHRAILNYEDYGKTWLAYKNKEQAEAKGEIVELPCLRKVANYSVADLERKFESEEKLS